MNKLEVVLPFEARAEDAGVQFITNGEQDEYVQARHNFMVGPVNIESQQLGWRLELLAMQTDTNGVYDILSGSLNANDNEPAGENDAVVLDFIQQGTFDNFVLKGIAGKVSHVEEKIDKENKDIAMETRSTKIAAVLGVVMLSVGLKLGWPSVEQEEQVGVSFSEFASIILLVSAPMTALRAFVGRTSVKNSRRNVADSLVPERERLATISEEIKTNGIQIV